MPRYDYLCKRCGPFTDWRPMNEAAEPARCPACRRMAPRMPSAPHVGTLSSGYRKAWERNERSAEEPRVVGRSRGEMGSKGHEHRDRGRRSGAGSGRPWMIGH